MNQDSTITCCVSKTIILASKGIFYPVADLILPCFALLMRLIHTKKEIYQLYLWLSAKPYFVKLSVGPVTMALHCERGELQGRLGKTLSQ